jgi:surface-anchored protein
MPKTTILSLTLATALTVSAAAAIFRVDHADIGVGFEEGEFDLHVHNEDNGVEFEPEAVTFLVKFASRITVPDGDQWNFLRPTGSTQVWQLDKEPSPDAVFLGFGSEEIEAGALDDNEFFLALTSLKAPEGAFVAVYDVDAFGEPSLIYSSRDGLDATDSRRFEAGNHEHFNVAFSAPGQYELTFTATAEVQGQTRTGTATYIFYAQSEADADGAQVVAQRREAYAVGTTGASITRLGPAAIDPSTGGAVFAAQIATEEDGTGAAIIRSDINGVLTPVATFKDAPANEAALRFRQFNDPVVGPEGEVAFVATLANKVGGATPRTDSVIALAHSPGTEIIVREGDDAPGLTNLKFQKFHWLVLDAPGSMVFGAKASGAGRPKSGVWRRLASGEIELVAAQGAPFATEVGPKIVKTILPLTNSPSAKEQTRAVSPVSELSLLVTFNDNTTAIVRVPGVGTM